METTLAISSTANGEIIKHAGQRTLTFKFGWLSRLFLEKIYGKGLKEATNETDEALWIANVLMCGLKSRAESNNLKDDFDSAAMYALLDEMKEEDVKEVWEVARHSLGFTSRLLGLSEEDVKQLAQAAVSSQSQPTGPASSN